MTNEALFEDLKQFIDRRFSMQDAKFEVQFGAIDDRLDTIDRRFDPMDRRFNAIDQRFDDNDMMQNEILNAIGSTFHDHEGRISALEKVGVQS